MRYVFVYSVILLSLGFVGCSQPNTELSNQNSDTELSNQNSDTELSNQNSDSEVNFSGKLDSDHKAPLVNEGEGFTMNLSQWKSDNSLPGVSFSYPPELKYITGGDTDGWSRSYLAKNVDESPYLMFTNVALLKCEFEDPSQCDLGTQVAATPDEVYAQQLASMKDWYGETKPFQIGGVSGTLLLNGPNTLGTGSTYAIVFHGAKGTFVIQTQQNPESDFMKLLLSTFKVQ